MLYVHLTSQNDTKSLGLGIILDLLISFNFIDEIDHDIIRDSSIIQFCWKTKDKPRCYFWTIFL